MVQETITKEMTIGDVVQKYPEVAEVFMNYGLHCVGCHVSPLETLEDGALGHGMDEETLQEMISEANKVIHAHGDHTGHDHTAHEPESKELLKITDKAAAKVLEILKKENREGQVLRIKVVPGGCSGLSYQFLVEEKAGERDTKVEKNGLVVVCDPQSLDVIKGSRIDYVETLNESGFKVDNPNAKRSCGCGSSFS